VPQRAVAGRFDVAAREAFIDGLQFLQACDVRLLPPQPFQQVRQARADAVDVEGRDPDGRVPALFAPDRVCRRVRAARVSAFMRAARNRILKIFFKVALNRYSIVVKRQRAMNAAENEYVTSVHFG
jgi:hypothetical protein